MPRVFDAEKRRIVRPIKGDLPGGNGLRDLSMERKIMSAAMDLLRKQDDELGEVISSAIDAASEQIAKKMKSSGEAHTEALADLKKELTDAIASAVRDMKPDDSQKVMRAVTRIESSLAVIQEATEQMTKEIKAEIKSQVAVAVESISADLKPPKKPDYTATVSSRDSSGYVKTVRITAQ